MKRANNRTRFEIIHDILALCSTPQKKTRIMSRTKLSYQQLEYYLMLLLGGGLLEYAMYEDVNDLGYRQYLNTTQEGRRVLQVLRIAIETTNSIFATAMVQTTVEVN